MRLLSANVFFGSRYCKQYGPRLYCSQATMKKSILKCTWIYAADKKKDKKKDKK